MRYTVLPVLATLAVLAACSSRETSESTTATTEEATPAEAAPTAPAAVTASPAATSARKAPPLALEGFGDLVIGAKVPASSSFKPRGSQMSETCIGVSSPDHPGVYGLVEGGVLRRITVAAPSAVTLVEGIGVGSTEKEVIAAFPGFQSEPHKYVAAPGKYLTQPGNDPRLRFEIGTDGTVTAMHVGVEPQLSYVEGCA